MRGGSVRFSRRGSMQLSIEAIIILVIAMVLLGLGLTFVKTLFAEGTGALIDKFEPIKEYCDVNAENPILPRTYTLKADKTNERMDVCIYNNVGATIDKGRLEVTECLDPISGDIIDLATTPDDFPIVIRGLSEQIDRNSKVGFKVTVITSEADVGTYLCKLQIIDDADPDKVIGPVQVEFNME